MGVLYLLIGLVLGCLVGGLFIYNKFSGNNAEGQNRMNALETERLLALQRLDSANKELERVITDYNQRLAKLDVDLKQANADNLNLNNRIAASIEKFNAQEQRLADQKVTLEEAYKKMVMEFQNTSNRLLEEKSQKFVAQNRDQLDIILNPFKEKLKEFENKVDNVYKSETEQRISLKNGLDNLLQLNKQLNQEAMNLTSALKGDNQKQGNWGELILDKVLERSGLVEGREYKKQVVVTNDDNERIKPDVVIFLPENKHIVVDSKVSLDAYEKYVSATDDQREGYAKKHIESVRNHIKLLSDKKYHTSESFHSPDFVILFIPIESSFSLAVKIDEELFNYSWDRKIVIVSPTTLLATLRTIASIWKQDRQTRNVLEIAKEGGALYDKFVGFLEDMEKINRGLGASQSAYNDAIKKLSDGRGNLINQTEKLKKLGAKAEKNIPEKYLENIVTPEDRTIENL